jgi:hypothetical protein
VFVWVLVGVLALTVFAGVWVGVRGVLAYGHLREAQTGAASLVSSLSDPTAAATAVPAIAEDTAAARELTSDPVWSAATGVPWVGPQLDAVATAIAAVDDVAGSALTPLVQSASGFSTAALRPSGGRFDVAALADLSGPAATAATGTADAAAAVDAINTSALLTPLADQIAEVGGLLDSAHVATDALGRATALMPAMLGAEGPRNYLVVFQNNAEWRSLGGIVGALAMIHTDGGAISLAAQGSSTDFPRYDSSVLPLSEELAAIYGQKPGQYIQNVTQVPSFPLAGQLAQEMWARENGTRVDGVLSLDPVALSYLLKATGPITLPTGDVLTTDNAVPLLLNEVYQRYERPADQDAFFQVAAAAVFDALASGAADPAALITALAQAGEEDRILVWNANPDEQAILDGTTLQGIPPATDAHTTAFGVYVNDGTGSKMDFYTHLDVGVGWCTDTEGAPDAGLSVTVRSDAPADAASLPSYITGGGGFDVPPGITRTVTYLYLPAGSEVVSSSAEDGYGASGFSTGTDGGRPVLTWATDLAPGTQATAHIRVRTPLTPEITAHVTPVLPGNSGEIAAAC